MVLQPEMRDVFAERQQKMIVAIMPRAEQRAGLGDQVSVMRFRFRRVIARAAGLSAAISISMVRSLAGRKINRAKIAPGNHGRIDQRFQRDGREFDRVARLLRDRAAPCRISIPREGADSDTI